MPSEFAPTVAAACPDSAKHVAVVAQPQYWTGVSHLVRGQSAQAD
ncbi:hypothetical protein [Scytonema sp. NUACC21]